MRPTTNWWLAPLLLLAGGVTGAAGADLAPAAFFGAYEGRASGQDESGLEPRDLNVLIEPRGEGFRVAWTTATRKADGQVKRKSYSVDFVPTRRPGIYSSAMKTNVFGGREALDPLRGEPYVWARIRGRTLTVHALIITDSGGYDLQVYDRSLRQDGDLDLRYARIREGQAVRLVEAVLRRRDSR